MTMSQVIRNRRQALALTQEQLAQQLNVTASAVNKWEKGTTCPDITLLAPLARILKTDINTLLCFAAEPDTRQLGDAMLAVAHAADHYGLAAALEEANKQLHLFPHSDMLQWQLALVLDGKALLDHATAEDRQRCQQVAETWMQQVAQGDSAELRHLALQSLANKRLQRGDVDGAQALYTQLPEGQKKRSLHARLLRAQGQEQASLTVQAEVVLTASATLQSALFQLLEIEMQENNDPAFIDTLIERIEQVCCLLDLQPMATLWPRLARALHLHQADEALDLLAQILQSLQKPWSTDNSVLYRHIEKRNASMASMTDWFLRSVEQDETTAFLRTHPRWIELRDAYTTPAGDKQV